jgi:hypothetical protein
MGEPDHLRPAGRVTHCSQIPCERDRNYTVQRGILLGIRIRETKHSSKHVFVRKTKLSQWANHDASMGDLRQKCTQNFTPKMTMDITFGRTMFKWEDNLYIRT